MLFLKKNMSMPNIALLRWLAALTLALLPAFAQAARAPSPEVALRAAHDAWRAGDAKRLARHAAALEGHVLAPWIEYWQLSLRLEKDAQADGARAFLDRHAGTLAAEQLRRDWLRTLGKAGQWELFQRELPLLVIDDAAVACLALLARARQNDASAFEEFRRYWNLPRELAEGCSTLADAALESGRIGPQQVWERFRVLSEAGLTGAAKRTLAYLPRGEALDARRVEAALASPAAFLDRGPDLRSRPARELAIFALTRLSRDDVQRAADLYGRMQDRFPREDSGYVWAMIATQAARRHMPEATAWFAEARDTPLADEQLAWRARIALRQLNWTEVHAAIEAMTPAGRSDPAWIYWLGRAHQAIGRPDEAKVLFSRIAGAPSFYAQLAAEELGLAIRLPPGTAPPTIAEISEAAANPGLVRALAFYRAGLRPEGTREWNWAIRSMDDRRLLAAAEIARRNEAWDRAINTAERTREAHDYAVRYPAPYREVLGAEARSHNLEEYWVLGLVRQESRFIAEARSSAGASGLMQLMPATARWVAQKFQVKNYSGARVTDVAVNARLGTAYLRHVLDDLDGHPLLAAAAYNAGPGRARRWRDARPLEGAIYAESIPFPETRDYVKKVMTNTLYYAALAGGPARTLKERLGMIRARPVAERVVALAAGNRQ